jgi:hypothetical protein
MNMKKRVKEEERGRRGVWVHAERVVASRNATKLAAKLI